MRSVERIDLTGELIVSFFNKLVIGKELFLKGSGFSPQISISFFNELATERKNYAQDLLFIF
jgi:hypothetical protein